MADQDEFGRELARRLADHEGRVPVEAPPKPGPVAARRWRPIVGGAAAAGIVAGGLLAFALLQRPGPPVAEGSESSSATSSPSATVEPTRSASEAPVGPTIEPPTPTPPEGPAPLAWREATAPDGRMNDLLWLGDRWLAVGWHDGRAASWTSAEGLVWTEGSLVDPGYVPQESEWFMNVVLPFDGHLLALGWERVGCCDGSQVAHWTSADGVTWTYVETRGTSFDTYGIPVAAALNTAGELVVISGIGLGSQSTIWITADAETWSEFPTSTGQFETMRDLAASPERLMAVGTSARSDSQNPRPGLWTSSDGRAWTSLAPPADADGPLESVAFDAAHGRFVIGGHRTDGRPAVWLTADGSSWLSSALASEPGSAQIVRGADGLLVAAGGVGAPPAGRTIAWSSHDGVTWQVMPFAPGTLGNPTLGVSPTGGVITLELNGGEPEYRAYLRVWAGNLEP